MGRGRAPCCAKVGLNKGAWTPEEDSRLVAYINKHGHGNWRALPKLAGLLRCGKSCRLRWINYLSPNIKRGNFTKEEEDTIFRLHKLLGNKWSKIAASLPGRTDNEIKNVWNTHLKKRLRQEEPKPEDCSQSSSSSTCSSSSAADLSCNSDNGESRRSELSETTLSDDLSLEALDPEIWDAAAFLETEDPLAQLEEEAQGRSQWVEYLEKELGLCESNQLEKELGLCESNQLEKSHHYHYQARDAELVCEEDPVSSYFLGDLNSVADLLDDVDLRVF